MTAASVVGLVPARGGSRGIPRKNLALLAGRPLIEYTIECARSSRTLDRLVVSTDDGEIAEVARRAGAEVPFIRPAALAADETPMLDVALHALEEIGSCDVLVVLQPTSPLRRPEHVDEAVELLLATNADAVVGVVDVPHRYSPDSLMVLEGDRLVPAVGSPPARRQDKPRLFARNGPAVLVLRAAGLRARGDLYGGDCRAYLMDARSSLDVDDPLDLELADCLLERAEREALS